MDPAESYFLLYYALVFVLLLLLSMFFSACETAFLSVSKLKLRYLVEKNDVAAQRVQTILKKKNTFLTGILIGNNIVNILTSTLVTAFAVKAFGSFGVGLATAFVTIFILIFGEILPKSLAIAYPELLAFRLSLPIKLFLFILSPLILFFNTLTNLLILPFLKNNSTQDLNISEEDIKVFIEIGEEEGNLQSSEKTILHNVLKFSNTPVKNIMTPRPEIIAVSIHSTIKDVLNLSEQTSFSRFPVYNKNIDNIKGFIYIKDILFHTDTKQLEIQDILRPVFFTYEYKEISELQLEFYTKNVNIALVLDEYGGIAGLVSTEDFVEKIIGAIEDEYDNPLIKIDQDLKTHIVQTNLLLSGQTLLEEIQEKLDITITSEFYDTLAGFILEKLDTLPEIGSKIDEQGYEFIVKEIVGNKIESVSISKISS